MAESIEPNPLDRPVFPTFDRILFGGERLRWRRAIDNSGLPLPLAHLVYRVVKRTRLWRSEKRTVALELIAHFHDGLSAGETDQQLIARFGNERAAAKLIRRGKKRNRPLIWHLWRYCVYTFLSIVGFYAVVLARFVLAHPTVKINYLAKLNDPIQATSPEKRAWPIYRRALLSLGAADGKRDKILDQNFGEDADGNDRDFTDLKPGDADWPTAAAWLHSHTAGLALVTAAAAKPEFGFIFGPGGSQHDPELGWDHSRPPENIVDASMFGVLLPALNDLRELANILRVDIRDAESQHDAPRALADINALLGIAAQQRKPFVITGLVSIGIDAMTLSEIDRLLANDPQLFDDAQWIALAHRLSQVGGDAASSVLDLSGERMIFYDLIQRTYSDDGHGDGILTPQGARAWPTVVAISGTRRDNFETAATFAVTGALSVVSSRRAVIDEYDRMMNLVEARFARPLRETTGPDSPSLQYSRRLSEIQHSPVLMLQYLPIAVLAPSLDKAGWTAERMLGNREGVEVGIALELYRRRNGSFPDSLQPLAPNWIPAIPADRITGDPIRYRLIDGHPVVYSVGVDRKDDGGMPAKDSQTGKNDRGYSAAKWDVDEATLKSSAGDWLLLDERPETPTTQPLK